MFTGIIETQAPILKREEITTPEGKALRIWVGNPFAERGGEPLQIGESIAVDGVCLTVEASNAKEIRFYLSSETLDRSTFGMPPTATASANRATLNLERAVLAHTRLSGHVVQGHVDALAQFLSVREIADSYLMTFEVPVALAPLMVEKGSITLNGISLTINRVIRANASSSAQIEIRIVPHTWQHTNLCHLQPWGFVNLEADVMAKSIHQYLGQYLNTYLDQYLKEHLDRYLRQAQNQSGNPRL